MGSIIDIYKNILTYEGSDIVIVIDPDNNIWFYAKQIINILEYKNEGTNVILKNFVDKLNKTSYKEIKEYSKYHYNVQDHSIFINEIGLYELILRSKKPKAEDFKNWVTQKVIPTIRKSGAYKIEKKYQSKLEKINTKIEKYKKRILVLENNQKKSKYPDGGYVYVLQPPNIETDEYMYKIGKTIKMKPRLNTYNTSLPDNMRVIYKIQVNDPMAVEYCVKGIINHLRYRKNKEYYKINRKTLINVVNKCAKDIKKSKYLKRDTMDSFDETDKEIFAIMGILSDGSGKQNGGTDTDRILKNNYLKNKNDYLALHST